MESFRLTQHNSAVVGEIRAAMARKGVKPLEVSSGIGLNRSGMYRRLNCETPFTLDELLAIAAFLGVSASSFFPQEVTAQ